MLKEKDWFKDAVVYQIYPKSFCDSNDDGIGDINGIISKLDYLKDLGINTIWISPCYPSPDADNGYDIADYQNIDPKFGTMDDFRRMLDEMHKRGIRLLMDLVVNHTSDEHKWFIESKKGKDNPYRDYYVWKDPVDGHEPNDWEAGFDTSAWVYDENSGQYWLHLFTPKQPDLNWLNPKVHDEIANMINWWLEDIGIDGFRCDVINLIAKDYDNPVPGDGVHLHEYLHELNQRCFKPNNAMTVGEVFGLSPEQSLELTAESREELSLVFQFEHMRVGRDNGRRFFPAEFSPKLFVDELARWQYGLNGKGWNSLCIENHDQPRSINRFGSLKYRKESATLLATLMYCMQGTVFIYEGQEIGQINPRFNSLDESIDCESKDIEPYLVENFGLDETLSRLSHDSRDCGRVPMCWDDSEFAGFSKVKPWIKVNDFYKDVNVAADLASEESVYKFYKKLLEIRRNNPVLLRGDFELLNNQDNIVIYKRCLSGYNSIYVVLNYGDENKTIENSFVDYNILIANQDVDLTYNVVELKPWHAIVLEANE